MHNPYIKDMRVVMVITNHVLLAIMYIPVLEVLLLERILLMEQLFASLM